MRVMPVITGVKLVQIPPSPDINCVFRILVWIPLRSPMMFECFVAGLYREGPLFVLFPDAWKSYRLVCESYTVLGTL